ncbi:lumican-like [Anopheles stephensi]|uniref:lumican-like n=1 Tax=Anopheles stephensi TaxID=30069 RepID=UPI001658ACA4|nr:lumican-like [Anopheles stephensi]
MFRRGNRTTKKRLLQMTIGSVHHFLSLSFATTIAAFHVICLNHDKEACTVENLHPEHEGTFVLHHLPELVCVLYFSQLMAKTVDHTIFSNLEPKIKTVLITDSAAVSNVILPRNITVEHLYVVKTGLEAMRFEQNDVLSVLYVEKAPLSHVPPTLVNLRNLTYLKINHTPLEQLHLELFCSLRALMTVDLNHNKIHYLTGPLQRSHECGPKLAMLMLGNNRLTTLHPHVFVPFGLLTSIKLSENMIETIAGGFKNTLVGQLALSDNMLLTFDLCDCVPMPNITFFEMDGNKLTHVPKCLERMPNVEVIILESNQLSAVSIAEFKGLQRLQHIRLAWNAIVSFTVHEHSLPPGLVGIDVRYNRLEHPNISQAVAQRVRIRV